MQDRAPMPPAYGEPDEVEPGLRRVLARNPSPMTLHGTNSYLVGRGDVAVIDPGPDDPAHLAALFAALDRGERISQETRLWDAKLLKTESMRSKEEAADYRYFPEPDLVPFKISPAQIEQVDRKSVV